MKSLGAVLDEFQGDCSIWISLHDLSAEKTNELQRLLGEKFTRVDKEHLRTAKNCPLYQSTTFEAYDALGFKAVHIDVYRDEKSERKGGDIK